jgi:mannose-6-phosphate isomerase-like protein (cupin superfamily)
MRQPLKKNLRSITLEEAHGGSGGRLLIFSNVDSVSMNLQAFTKGFLNPKCVFDWHQHDKIDEFFIVLKGSGIVQYRNAANELICMDYKIDDTFYMPAGVSHRIECQGSETSEYFFIRITDGEQ